MRYCLLQSYLREFEIFLIANHIALVLTDERIQSKDQAATNDEYGRSLDVVFFQSEYFKSNLELRN